MNQIKSNQVTNQIDAKHDNHNKLAKSNNELSLVFKQSGCLSWENSEANCKTCFTKYQCL